MYSYDKKPLDPVVEATDNSDERWTRESITFAAGYGIERVGGYLYVPKHHSRFPLQTVVIFPGSYAIDVHSSKQELLDF
jgi:cephalosporin-C deacetylase-like acetyl esterase